MNVVLEFVFEQKRRRRTQKYYLVKSKSQREEVSVRQSFFNDVEMERPTPIRGLHLESHRLTVQAQ